MSIRFILQNNRFINNKSQPIIPKKETDIMVNTQLKRGVVTNNTIESVSNHTPTEKNNKGYEVSILITAYNVQDYIEECLDSILKQKFISKINYEIIVGVDNCEPTLSKLISIRDKYENLKILMMDKNVGTYITRNTLVTVAKYDNLLFFDSDDIMYDNLLEEVLNYITNNEVVYFHCDNFYVDTMKIERQKWFATGVFLIKKDLLSKIGGFLPNRFGCDSELYARIKNFLKIKIIKKSLFKRRKHQNNLTTIIPIGGDVRTRWGKENIKKNYTKNDLFIEPTTSVFDEIIIRPKTIIDDDVLVPIIKEKKPHEVSILITAYNAQDYIEETLDSILKQKSINKIDYEIIVGVDACNKTLQKLESIKHKYGNLKILMMDKNVGTYITRNTLVTVAKYDNLLFFDSDDIMYDNLLYEILKVGGDIEVVRFCYKIFKKNIRYSKPTNCKYGANGVFLIRKETFNKFGGFLPNRFSFDAEFQQRIKKFVKLKIINEPLFFYRRHDNNLTVTIPIGGDIRIKWDKENIKSNYTIEESYIKPIITTFKEII